VQDDQKAEKQGNSHAKKQKKAGQTLVVIKEMITFVRSKYYITQLKTQGNVFNH
jgi:hypothetical protein